MGAADGRRGRRGRGEPALVALVLLAVIAAAAGCSTHQGATSVRGPVPGAGPAPVAPAGGGPVFRPGPCPVPVPAGRTVDCGTVAVPEDRRDPDGAVVVLAVAVLRSPAPARDDPVVYLAGGPGSSAIDDLASWAGPWAFLDDRDLVLVDQRGTGASVPSLDCPGLPAGEPTEEVVACLDRLRAAGIGLEHYDSAAAAADLDDVRRALGIRQWNLFGISYGTRLALTVLRDHPDGVRSAVLDSVYPPEVDAIAEEVRAVWRAVDALLAHCGADRACNRTYPDVKASLLRVVDQLTAEPVVVDGPDGEEVVDGAWFLWALWAGMYLHDVIPSVPRAVAAAERGDVQTALELLGDPVAGGRDRRAGSDGEGDSGADGDGAGLFYAVECREEYPFTSDAARRFANAGVPPSVRRLLEVPARDVVETCRRVAIPPAERVEADAVVSDVPVLLLAGEFDPVTPPRWAASAARTLGSSQRVTFPGLGHAVIDGGGCPARIVTQFLGDPSAPVDAGCTAGLGVDWDLG